MLSYQHIYHAGNVVDCQKHILLSALLQQLDGFHYIDTHSGRGLYDLAALEALKIQEFKDGIDKIWSLSDWPKEIAAYQHLLEDLNPDGICRYYPGSPMVAYAHAQDGDRIDLYEIHPQELNGLQDNMDGLKHVHVHNQSGWDILANGLHAHGKHSVILIDPSYELKNEYEDMVRYITQALKQLPDAIIMIWYPLLKAMRHQEMLDDFRQSGIGNILQTEIHTALPEQAKGLYGTGMLIINPPKGFDTIVASLSTWLAKATGISTHTEFLVR